LPIVALSCLVFVLLSEKVGEKLHQNRAAGGMRPMRPDAPVTTLSRSFLSGTDRIKGCGQHEHINFPPGDV
jgi:hypothetical protein